MADWKPYIVNFHKERIHCGSFKIERNVISGIGEPFFEVIKHRTTSEITFRTMKKRVIVFFNGEIIIG